VKPRRSLGEGPSLTGLEIQDVLEPGRSGREASSKLGEEKAVINKALVQRKWGEHREAKERAAERQGGERLERENAKGVLIKFRLRGQ